MKALLLTPLLCLYLAAAGCPKTTGDPLVVNAEKTTAIAADTFDTFVKLEFNHREELAKVSPQIHTYADTIRHSGVQWLQDARSATQAYKHNRTADNKANLGTALAVLANAIATSQHYINQAGGQ